MNCHGEHHDAEVSKEYMLYEARIKFVNRVENGKYHFQWILIEDEIRNIINTHNKQIEERKKFIGQIFTSSLAGALLTIIFNLCYVYPTIEQQINKEVQQIKFEILEKIKQELNM